MRDMTKEEQYDAFLRMACDESNPPDMVHGMLGAIGQGLIKVITEDGIEPNFVTTEKGDKFGKDFFATPEGKEIEKTLNHRKSEGFFK